MTLLSTFCGLLLLVQASATGTVSGRITDEQGQPAVDVPVQLVRGCIQPAGQNVSGRRFHECGRPWRLPALRSLTGRLLSARWQFSGTPRAAGAAEWPFDSRVCVELLSWCDGRQPGSADRSEEWI